MIFNRYMRNGLVLLLVLTNIGCDQISKNIVRKNISDTQNIGYFANHFTLMKVENTGAFLSMGNSMPPFFRILLLIVLPILSLIGALIFVLLKKGLNGVQLLAACCLLGGGAGNIYDRVMHGSVTDFMHIGFGPLQTGIFNMADVSVTTGILLLLFTTYLSRKPVAPQALIE
jgi:signal peptidase II